MINKDQDWATGTVVPWTETREYGKEVLGNN